MAQQHRIALVIGNSAYHQGALANPVNDAALVTARLNALGFEIVGGASNDRYPTGLTAGSDPSRKQFFDLIQTFLGRLQDGSTALIYYAGHALQIFDKNYLMPVDAKFTDDAPLLDLIEIKPKIEEAAERVGADGTVVIFLDACRNNPLSNNQLREVLGHVTRSAPLEHGQREPVALTRGGLSTVKMNRNGAAGRTFIGFATAPGDVALDGETDALNSPFAATLGRHLRTRGLEIKTLFNRVQCDVQDTAAAMGKYQDPWSESNLDRELFLYPRSMWPIYLMGLGGLGVGLIVSALLFNAGTLLRPPPYWMWYLGSLFGLICTWGTLQWGSRKWQDAIFAFLGPVFGCAVALAVLMMIPAEPLQLTAAPISDERTLASKVFGAATGLGMLIYFAGIIMVRMRQKAPWPRTAIGRVNRILSWVLPLMVAATLGAIDFLLAYSNLYYTSTALCALLAGILYAASAELGCRSQLGIFKNFGPFTGAVSVGLMMAVLFAAFAWLKFGYKMQGDYLQMLMVGFGGLWHMLLGMQLGYCFAYYVPEHIRKGR
jgi:uncharacterized caspase-like protein